MEAAESIPNHRPTRFLWAWLASVAAVVLLVFPAATYLLLDWRTDPSIEWIHGLRARKHAAAAQAEGQPRLLITGGSSGLFSIDTVLLGKRLGKPCFNLATHAGLGLREFLQDMREVAKPGDTVLLYAELAHYSRKLSPLLDLEREYLWTYRPKRLLDLPFEEAVLQVYGNPWSEYTEAWARRSAGLARPDPTLERRGYSALELSPTGDFRSDSLTQLPDATRRGMKELKITKEMTARVGSFCRWAKERNITVLAARPAIMRPQAETNEFELKAYRQLADFYQKFGVACVEAPEFYQLPFELFYDTVNHANAAGRRVITEVLAQKLRPLLKLPPAPPSDTQLLVASRAYGVERGGLLAEQSPKACFFLSAVDLHHPLCLTPEMVKTRLARGERFVGYDPEVFALLEKAGLTTRVTAQSTATLRDWWNAYPGHLFAIAAVGKVDCTAWLASAPVELQPLLAAAQSAKAGVFKIGAEQKHARMVQGEAVQELVVPAHDALLQGAKYPVSIVLRTGTSKGGNVAKPAIRVGAFPMEEPSAPGISVAVYDPATGTVVRHAHFTQPELRQWELREVLPTPTP